MIEERYRQTKVSWFTAHVIGVVVAIGILTAIFGWRDDRFALGFGLIVGAALALWTRRKP